MATVASASSVIFLGFCILEGPSQMSLSLTSPGRNTVGETAPPLEKHFVRTHLFISPR